MDKYYCDLSDLEKRENSSVKKENNELDDREIKNDEIKDNKDNEPSTITEEKGLDKILNKFLDDKFQKKSLLFIILYLILHSKNFMDYINNSFSFLIVNESYSIIMKLLISIILLFVTIIF